METPASRDSPRIQSAMSSTTKWKRWRIVLVTPFPREIGYHVKLKVHIYTSVVISYSFTDTYQLCVLGLSCKPFLIIPHCSRCLAKVTAEYILRKWVSGRKVRLRQPLQWNPTQFIEKLFQSTARGLWRHSEADSMHGHQVNFLFDELGSYDL
jgi:hypothetical protein